MTSEEVEDEVVEVDKKEDKKKSKVKEPKRLESFSMEDLDPTGYLSSGNYPLDIRLGNADLDISKPMGVGRGKMIELYGPNKSAKSELSQAFIRSAFKDPLADVIYYDQEWSADSRKLGIKPGDWEARGWKLFRADSLEQFYSNCRADLKELLADQRQKKTFGTPKSRYKVIILDSLAAIKAVANAEKLVGESVIAAEARLNSEEMPRLRKLIGLTGSILIWVNQTRGGKIGQSPMPGSSNESTPGGEAPKFYADYRVKMSFISNMWMKTGKTAPKVKSGPKSPPDGFMTSCKLIKNKIAPPMSETELIVWFRSPVRGGMSGISEAWTVFAAMHASKKLAPLAGTGMYKIVGAPEIDNFPRSEWDATFAARRERILEVYTTMIQSQSFTWGDDDDDTDDDDE